MFKNLLKTDFFQEISREAESGIIKEDRLKYKKIFDETNTLIENDDIIILSDIDIILNHINKKNKTEIIQKNMTIYTTHPRRTTTMITNDIHDKNGKFVVMKAVIPNLEYEIIFDMRSLIKIYHIDRYKNIDIPQLFNAIKINHLNYFPPEIELMDIYHKLYLPNYNEEWESILPQEKLLYEYCMKNTNTITGGKNITDKCIDCKKRRNVSINNIKLLLINFLDNCNYILIGEFAKKLINNEKFDELSENIQIITENPIEQDYNNIVNFLSVYTNYGIHYKKQKLYTPKDNRIYKHTFYIKYPSITANTSDGSRGIDKQFLDIYNCGTFEIIPYIEKKYNNMSLRVGNLFVQLRFLLLDLWLYRVLYEHVKILDDKKFKEKAKYIIDTMKLMKKKMPFDFKNKYMGINYDEKIEQKIVISEKNIHKSSYYPELSMKKTKNYKLIATSS